MQRTMHTGERNRVAREKSNELRRATLFTPWGKVQALAFQRSLKVSVKGSTASTFIERSMRKKKSLQKDRSFEPSTARGGTKNPTVQGRGGPRSANRELETDYSRAVLPRDVEGAQGGNPQKKTRKDQPKKNKNKCSPWVLNLTEEGE